MITTKVRERGIIFSEPMVQALLENRKSQTRRIIKEQPLWWQGIYDFKDGTFSIVGEDYESHSFRCPYGYVGDRLYVKESFLPCSIPAYGLAKPSTAGYVCYRDGSQKFKSNGAYYPWKERVSPSSWPEWAKWSSPVFMPKWASRITLEITGVTAQRAHDITEEDALSEGIFEAGNLGIFMYNRNGTPGPHCRDSARLTYACLFDSINGEGAWSRNNWLWKISFKRVDNES